MTFDKVKELIRKLDEKDMAQLKRQRELSIWLKCSSSPLKFFPEYIRWPQSEYHKPVGAGKWWLPTCCAKYAQYWMTADAAQVISAVSGFLAHEVTVEKTFVDVKVALERIAETNEKQYERQKQLESWLEREGRDDYAAFIKWPQKEKWSTSYWSYRSVWAPREKNVLNPDVLANNPHGRFTRVVARSEYPEHSALNQAVAPFLAYKQVVDVTFVEVTAAVNSVYERDHLQKQRQADLKGWSSKKKQLVRPYADLIKWPQQQDRSDRYRQEWWGRNRAYSEYMWVSIPSHTSAEVVLAVNNYLQHSVDVLCTLADVKACILELDEIDQSQLKRQEDLKKWLKENAGLKRPYELIRWPWVRKTTETIKTYWETAPPDTQMPPVLFTEAEHIKTQIIAYLAHAKEVTADLSSIKHAILELDAVDKAQYERQKVLSRWINKIEFVWFMKTVRWPWSLASGHRYETYSGAYQGVYGAREFGDFLAHSLHVNTSFENVKEQLNALNRANGQAAGGARSNGLQAFLA